MASSSGSPQHESVDSDNDTDGDTDNSDSPQATLSSEDGLSEIDGDFFGVDDDEDDDHVASRHGSESDNAQGVPQARKRAADELDAPDQESREEDSLVEEEYDDMELDGSQSCCPIFDSRESGEPRFCGKPTTSTDFKPLRQMFGVIELDEKYTDSLIKAQGSRNMSGVLTKMNVCSGHGNDILKQHHTRTTKTNDSQINRVRCVGCSKLVHIFVRGHSCEDHVVKVETVLSGNAACYLRVPCSTAERVGNDRTSLPIFQCPHSAGLFRAQSPQAITVPRYYCIMCCHLAGLHSFSKASPCLTYHNPDSMLGQWHLNDCCRVCHNQQYLMICVTLSSMSLLNYLLSMFLLTTPN
jgi:hypothetical protein